MGVHESDEVLATRILVSRSQEAYTDLYHKHRGRATDLASRFFSSPDLVDAAVNQAFQKAFVNLATWNCAIASFSTWLASIVQRACIDIYRKRKSEAGRHHELTLVRHGYLLPELFPDNPCEHHSAQWFKRDVRIFIRDYLERVGHDRIRMIVDPPDERLSDRIRARQSRDRHRIAEPLEIRVSGRELSRRVTNELLLASICGKVPGGMIQ